MAENKASLSDDLPSRRPPEIAESIKSAWPTYIPELCTLIAEYSWGYDDVIRLDFGDPSWWMEKTRLADARELFQFLTDNKEMRALFACAFPPLRWRTSGRFAALWRQLPISLERENASGYIELYQYNFDIKHALHASITSILKKMARDSSDINATKDSSDISATEEPAGANAEKESSDTNATKESAGANTEKDSSDVNATEEPASANANKETTGANVAEESTGANVAEESVDVTACNMSATVSATEDSSSIKESTGSNTEKEIGATGINTKKELEATGIKASDIDSFEGHWEIQRVIRRILPYYMCSADNSQHTGVVDPSVSLPIASHILWSRIRALVDAELDQEDQEAEEKAAADVVDREEILLRVLDIVESDMSERFPPCVAEAGFLEPVSVTVLAEDIQDLLDRRSDDS